MSLTHKTFSVALPALLLVLLAAACGSNGGTDNEITDLLARPTAETDVTGALADFAEEPAAPKVGRNVGDRVPDFTITLDDGTVKTSAEMVASGRPGFMFFFATWCPICRRELTELKDIYPDFADGVDFIAIGQDPTEPLEALIAYRDKQGHPWPVAIPGRGMLAAFRITSQSFKIAFDADGVITYREGYNRGDEATWRDVMAGLAGR